MKEPSFKNKGNISILFLAADPSNSSRLRLGEEAREVHEKLQRSRERDRFVLNQRWAVRPEDLTQALLDIEPQVVHFSGFGMLGGGLCFEDKMGRPQSLSTGTLASLFQQFTDQIECVLLNACYVEIQAKVISQHVESVIGISKGITNEAAIAFVVGFYQALGAGRPVENAYRLGLVQIQLQNLPVHLTPVLFKKGEIVAPHPSTILYSQQPVAQSVKQPVAELRIQEVIRELEGIIKDAENNNDVASVDTTFRKWRDKTTRLLEESYDKNCAFKFTLVDASSFIKGRQPRLISEARACLKYLLSLS